MTYRDSIYNVLQTIKTFETTFSFVSKQIIFLCKNNKLSSICLFKLYFLVKDIKVYFHTDFYKDTFFLLNNYKKLYRSLKYLRFGFYTTFVETVLSFALIKNLFVISYSLDNLYIFYYSCHIQLNNLYLLQLFLS